MKIKRNDLLNALDCVKLPVDADFKNNPMESCYIFTKHDLYSENGYIRTEMKFDCDFEFAVPKDEFYNIIKRTKTDEIDLDIDNENRISIKSGKMKAYIVMPENYEELINNAVITIEDDEKNIGAMQDLPPDFCEGAKLCMPTISKDVSRGYLTCLYISKNMMISSDDERLSKYDISEDMKGGDILIPGLYLNSLLSYDLKRYSIDENVVYFLDANDVLLIANMFSEDYPYEIFESYFTFEGARVKFPSELIEAIESAKIFLNEDDQIKITIKKSEIICEGQNNTGYISTSVKSRSKLDNDVSFNISPAFIKQICEGNAIVKINDVSLMYKSDNYQQTIGISILD